MLNYFMCSILYMYKVTKIKNDIKNFFKNMVNTKVFCLRLIYHFEVNRVLYSFNIQVSKDFFDEKDMVTMQDVI